MYGLLSQDSTATAEVESTLADYKQQLDNDLKAADNYKPPVSQRMLYSNSTISDTLLSNSTVTFKLLGENVAKSVDGDTASPTYYHKLGYR